MATKVAQYGRVSVRSVASGGRMRQVMGEDATELAAPATSCTSQCQAQNRGQGDPVDLGCPFTVPVARRLTPALPV